MAHSVPVSVWWNAALDARSAIAALQAADPPMRTALQADVPGQGIYGLGQEYQRTLDEVKASLAVALVWLENTGYTLAP